MGWGYKSEHRHIYDYEADMFTGITTYHGMVRIYNSRTWMGRWFWIFIVFTAFVLFVVQAFTLLFQYHGRPTMTQINFVVPKNGMKFPVITLCNFNPIKKSKLQEWNMSREVVDYAMMAFLQPYDLEKDYNASYVDQLHNAFINYADDYKKTYKKEFMFRDFYHQAGFDCKDLFLNCSYGGKIFNCCNTLFMSEIMTDYGKCFQLQNVDSNIQMVSRWSLAQTVDGLEILIDIQRPETPDFFVNDIFDAGIKFLVHDKQIVPLLSVNTLAVSPGYKAYGPVSYRNITLLPKENGWGMCRNNWNNLPYQNSKLYIDGPYSNINCMKNCLVNVFKDLCGCVPIRYQVLDKLDVCTPKQLLNCTITNTRQEIWNNFWSETCGCDVECDRLDFDVSMSYSTIPNREAQKYLASFLHKNGTYMDDNFIVLNLYNKQIYYERHEQTKTLNQMSVLSQIGGSMGLFMGMSIITLAEVFIFLVKTVYGMLYGNRKTVKQDRQDSQTGQYNFSYDNNLENYDTIYDPPDWFLHESNRGGEISRRPTYIEVPRSRTPTMIRPQPPIIIVEGIDQTQDILYQEDR